MSKYLLNILLFTAIGSLCTAQIKFQKISSHQMVLDQCKLSRKIIFYFIESSNCGKCTKIAKEGLDDPELSKLFNTTFYNIKISTRSTYFNELTKLFPKIEYSGFAFITPDNYLIEYVSYTTNSKPYYKNLTKNILEKNALIEKALSSDFNSSTDSLDYKFVETEIYRNNILQRATDSLVTSYIARKYKDSMLITDLDDALLILKAGLPLRNPIRMRLKKSITSIQNDSLWYSLPLEQRIAINEQITEKSLKEAVKTKDKMFAYEIAEFYQNINSDKAWGTINNFNVLIRYYTALKDTDRIVSMSRFLVTHLVSIIDSQWIHSRALYNNFANEDLSDYLSQINHCVWNALIVSKSDKYFKDIASVMNTTLAWFKYAGTSSAYLKNAYYDTFAHVYYRLGDYEKALQLEQEALELSKSTDKSNVKKIKRKIEFMKRKGPWKEIDFFEE
ncbi:MAG: tetratricopeptide repeat protein [Saprospiraceae bacterium]|nr:tetratricopeptide repeat protein [Saprospiraceae bacterium]MBK8296525.1 tetratricopeptide repeat protein [Saprospiraceae bacterium]